MPENTEQVEDNATQGATAEKTFTQAELDAIVGERLKRERQKHADYDKLKAKAAKYDEAEEASKSELQKAVEERDALKARLDKLEADRARAEEVAKAATEYGVDAALLSRMSGDVADNAQFLKQMGESHPKHGAVPDFGEAKQPASKKSTAQMFADAVNAN